MASDKAPQPEDDLLRALLRAVPDPLWLKDPEGRYLACNRAAERILGVPEDTAKGRTDHDFVPKELADLFRQRDREAMAAGKPTRNEEWLTFPDTGYRGLFETVKTPLRDATGLPIGVLGIARDISELRAARIRAEESESRFRTMAEESADWVWMIDAAGHHTYSNRMVHGILGRTLDEFLATDPLTLVHPDDVASYVSTFEQALAGRQGWKAVVVRWRRADGHYVMLESNAAALFDADGKLLGFLGVDRDITDRIEAAVALRESEARYRALFEGSGDGIFVTTPDGAILDCNQSAAGIFRCRREDLIGTSIACLSPERQADGGLSAHGVARINSALFEGQLSGIFEWRHQRLDGTVFDAEVNLKTVAIDGQVRVIGAMRDISSRKQAEARIEFLAHHDPLTGLPNRVLLRDRFEHAHAYAQRNGSKVAMLFIDLDNFKAVNDSLGHAAGDELLKAVVQRLDTCVRQTDTVSRQGGDEFIVLLNDVPDTAAAERVAGEILVRLAEPFTIGGNVYNSGGSIGIAVCPMDGNDFDTLLQKADTAMYNAKAAGRNTYRFFTEAMNARVREHLLLQSHLHLALSYRQFRLAYQPKFSIDGRKLTGLEALLRWTDPDLGEIAPSRFIPVAEDCGLIVPIGRWVMMAVCRQMVEWRSAGLEVPPVSVNLSAVQFHRPGLIATVSEVLKETGIPPELLELELTESLLLHDVEHTLTTVRGLKDLGVGLSIDDFGTGYSSLAYLKRFSVDKLKIDRSFVRDIGSDPDDAAIVRAVIQLARSLRLGTVAEGVETEEQLAFLRAEGCEEAQGFLLGRPQAPDAIFALLRGG